MVLVTSATPDKPITRKLTWFEKDCDIFVGKVRLNNLNTGTLKHLYGSSEDRPFYYCRIVLTQEQLLYLQQFTFHQIDVLAYDYFLEP